MADPLPEPVSLRRNVLIFRSELLSYSETFIPSQAEKFKIFTPYYTGFKRKIGFKLPVERTLAPSRYSLVGRARNLAAVFGVIDGWYERNIRAFSPKLIHAHFEEGGINAIVISQRLKIPLFLTCQGYDVTVKGYRWEKRRGLGGYYQHRRKVLFEQASLCFGVSRFICDQMLRRGYPAKKIMLLYTGIDTKQFCPDAAISKKPQILFVGRLVEKKGCEDLINAMRKVSVRSPEIQLVVVGEGPLRKSLEEMATANKINVRFAGIQTPPEVLRLLRESLLLCAPSVTGKDGDCEGLPNVIFEAQSVGLPVVATRHAGIPEAVDHGVTGILGEERHPVELAENICAILSDNKLRVKMGQSARALMLDKFDMERQSGFLEQTYLDHLSR